MLVLINATKAITIRCSSSYNWGNHSPRASLKSKLVNDVSFELWSKLLEIPLQSFNSDFNYWPTFRDRFSTLVNDRSEIPKIDKMHYLIECLKSTASDAIRIIPVSADNFDLTWSTLASRFHRSQLVATAFINKLLRNPVSHKKRCTILIISYLLSPKVFRFELLLTFQISSCLLGFLWLFSVYTRKLYESSTPPNFPSVDHLLTFVQSRVSILEIADCPHKINQLIQSHTTQWHIRQEDINEAPYFLSCIKAVKFKGWDVPPLRR